ILESASAATKEVGAFASDHTAVPASGIATLIEILPSDVLEKLKAVSGREASTLSAVFLCAYRTLLYRYSGEEDAANVPTANRNGAAMEALVSFCGIAALADNPTFRQLLGRNRSVAMGASFAPNEPFQD